MSADHSSHCELSHPRAPCPSVSKPVATHPHACEAAENFPRLSRADPVLRSVPCGWSALRCSNSERVFRFDAKLRKPVARSTTWQDSSRARCSGTAHHLGALRNACCQSERPSARWTIRGGPLCLSASGALNPQSPARAAATLIARAALTRRRARVRRGRARRAG